MCVLGVWMCFGGAGVRGRVSGCLDVFEKCP